MISCGVQLTRELGEHAKGSSPISFRTVEILRNLSTMSRTLMDLRDSPAALDERRTPFIGAGLDAGRVLVELRGAELVAQHEPQVRLG